MEEHHSYKKNYITDVIFKINFAKVEALSAKPSSLFIEAIKENFPIAEQVNQMGLLIAGDGKNEPSFQRSDKTIWRFRNSESSKSVELDFESLVVNFKVYKDFDELKECLTKVTSEFFKVYPDLTINRLGLRFIDQINLKEDTDIFSWDKYINPSLVKSLDFVEQKELLRRMVNYLEFAIDEDTKLAFRYGIFNSLYPSKILNKEFFLDYDCFTTSPLQSKDIIDKVSSFSKITSEYFEKSITEDFRRHLNEEQ